MTMNYWKIQLLMLLLINLGSTTARAVSTISGFVRDMNGNPIVNVDLDIIDIPTGLKLPSVNDNTDINGFYSITVLVSTFYHITFAPPAGTRFLGQRFDNFDLTASRSFDLVLNNGIAIAGIILDERGAPIGDVDFDADNFVTGRVFTPDDNSNIITGAYQVVLPPGRYRFRYDPLPGGIVRGFQIDTVDVTVDTIINITLLDGAILSGSVSDAGGIPIEDVDIGLREIPSGNKIFISKNSSDSLGTFRLVVPTGLFELRFEPSRGSKFLAARIDSFNIAGDLVWNQTLEAGLLLTVEVTNSLGMPVVKADIDIKEQLTGLKLFTPNDGTDATGIAEAVVPPNQYIVQVDPPLGSIFDQVIVNNVNINQDTTIMVVLQEISRVNVAGRIEDINGLAVPDVEIDLLPVTSGVPVYLVDNVTDTSGNFSFAAPVGLHDVLLIPDISNGLIAQQIDSVMVNIDTTWSTTVMISGIQVQINLSDKSGSPVVGADIDLFDVLTGKKQFTPRDNSNELGVATVIVASGQYRITASPPTNSFLHLATLDAVNITADTTINMILSSFGQPEEGLNFVLAQNYPNPFADNTSIPYLLLSPSEVRVSIYNVLGQQVKTLLDGQQSANQYLLNWDCTGRNGEIVANGIYFYRLETLKGSQTLKMTLVR